ncbi:hypothetical protein U9M48_022169, partial [Paspalum notatum var. saurae]
NLDSTHATGDVDLVARRQQWLRQWARWDPYSLCAHYGLGFIVTLHSITFHRFVVQDSIDASLVPTELACFQDEISASSNTESHSAVALKATVAGSNFDMFSGCLQMLDLDCLKQVRLMSADAFRLDCRDIGIANEKEFQEGNSLLLPERYIVMSCSSNLTS